MSWSDQDPAERQARKRRRAQRRLRQQSNRAQFATHKQVEAHSPTSTARDHAAHQWDVARKHISRLRNPAEQEQQWRRLEQVLAEFNAPQAGPLTGQRSGTARDGRKE